MIGRTDSIFFPCSLMGAYTGPLTPHFSSAPFTMKMILPKGQNGQPLGGSWQIKVSHHIAERNSGIRVSRNDRGMRRLKSGLAVSRGLQWTKARLGLMRERRRVLKQTWPGVSNLPEERTLSHFALFVTYINS